MSFLRRVPWPVWSVLSGIVLGFSQPFVIESIGGRAPLDSSGLSGLLALVGLVPVMLSLWRSDGTVVGRGGAYARGFVAWLTHFAIVLYWIEITLRVYGGLPVFVSVPVLLLLAATLAAFLAAAFAVSIVIHRRFALPLWLVVPVALTGTEMLRVRGPLGGFPWGSLGHSFATVPILLQGAALVGTTGLVLVAALVNGALVELVRGARKRELRRAPAVLVVALAGIFLPYGAWRLGTQHDDEAQAPHLAVGLLQPNVNEGIADLVRAGRQELRDRFFRLQDHAIENGAALVLWPEGSFPSAVNRDATTFEPLHLVAPGGKVPKAAVVGAVAVFAQPDKNGKRAVYHHNAAFIIGAEQRVMGRADKAHLVPFGEYVPWPLDGIIPKFIPIPNTAPGEVYRPTALDIDGRTVRVGSIICYEGVFPEISRTLALADTDLIVNLTDDRWYGVSSMASQHLLMYALRAVETGRSIVRSANTGISAWLDTRGFIHDATAMYTEASVVADVPLVTLRTPYLVLGDALAWLCTALTMVLWIAAVLGASLRTHARLPLQWALGAGGAAAVVVGVVMVLRQGSRVDEAGSTQALLLVVAGLLVGVGALSQRPWGRRAVGVVGLLALVGGAVGVMAAAPLAPGIVAAIGALLLVTTRPLRRGLV